MPDEEDVMGLSKAERERGYRPVPQPNEQHIAVLRRVARGFLLVTHTTGKDGSPVTLYTYEDGTPMTSLNKKGDNSRVVARMVAEGWLIPIENEALPFHGEPMSPQRCRARTIADGPTPRFVKNA